MSLFGYSGEMSEFCMDPHSRAGFLLHPSNQSMLRPVFPTPVSSVHSNHSNYKSPVGLQSQTLPGKACKKKGGGGGGGRMRVESNQQAMILVCTTTILKPS